MTVAKGEAIVASEILDLLKETGFENPKIVVSRYVPGTKEYPKDAKSAPQMVSEKLTPVEVAEFKEDLDIVLQELDVNEFASFDTFSSQKLE